MRQIVRRTKRREPRLALAVLTAVGLSGAAACNSLLEVDIPGRVEESALDNPLLASTMVVGALGEFECAYAKYVTTTGILSEEFIVSGFTIPSNIWGWRGEVEIKATPGGCGGGGYGFYTPMQRARFMAEDGSRRIEAFPDAAVSNKTGLLAQLAAYAGYSYTLLGEGMCEMAVDEGPLMTRAQVWTKAEEWFTKAINQAGSDASILNMARVGRARVRLDLGRATEAAADADLVPSNFVRNAVYSATITRRENGVYTRPILDRDLSVAPAFRGLTVGGVSDTRVSVLFANRNGGDGVTPQWDQLKYTARNSPIPIASYDEAQLIIAEARAGTQEAFDAINRLRTKANLPLLAAGTTVDVPLVLEERRRELWLEGHWLNDMLRHNLPFRTGVNHKNQTLGPVTCVPLPDVERLNNPNI